MGAQDGWRAFLIWKPGLTGIHLTVNLTPVSGETIGLGTSCYSSKA